MSPHALARFRAASTPVLLSLALALLCLVVTAVGDNALTRAMVELLVRVVLVVGLWVFVGNSGVVSFGHAGFMAIGAYASAWLTIRPQMKALLLPGLPDWLMQAQWAPFQAAVAAGLAASAAALLVGAAVLRLSGIAASIATFAFLAIVNTVYSNWSDVTGGMSSVVGLPRYVDLGAALGWAVAAIVIASLHAVSASGLALRATREDEVAAAASGIDMYRHRLGALAISAFLSGVGGALLGHMIGVLNPDAFYLGITFLTLAMLVVGGIGTLTGAVAGTAAISALLEALVRLESGVEIAGARLALPAGAQEIIIGIAMILCLVFRPQGLSGGAELRVPASWPGAAARAVNADDAFQRNRGES